MDREALQQLIENDDLGYIYVLRSKSAREEIANEPNLYKIGFSSGPIEARIKDAKEAPTYLMADVSVDGALCARVKFGFFDLDQEIFRSVGVGSVPCVSAPPIHSNSPAQLAWLWWSSCPCIGGGRAY